MPDRASKFAGLAPYLLLALASLCWSGNHVLGRAIAGQVPPFAISTIRWAVPALLLLPFALPHLRRDWPVIRSHWAIILFLALTGTAIFGVLQYVSLTYTTATNMAVFQSFGPVLIAVAGALLFHDRLSLLQAFGVATSLVGVLLIVARGHFATLLDLNLNVGDLIALFNMSLWGIYSASVRKRPPIHWLSFTFLLAIISVAATTPFFVWEHLAGHTLQPTWTTVGALAYAGLFPSLVAIVCWNRGVERVGSNQAGATMHLMGLFGPLLAWLILDERLHAYHMAGFALILSGVWLTARRR
ncbi:MAG: DMT family transporter [Hyphomicrobiaceae bacterium]